MPQARSSGGPGSTSPPSRSITSGRLRRPLMISPPPRRRRSASRTRAARPAADHRARPPVPRAPGPPAARLPPPGPPAELRITARARKSPGPEAIRAPARRAELIHTFLHHELQAAELMCWAILAFPGTPEAFRLGLLGVARDEIRHM